MITGIRTTAHSLMRPLPKPSRSRWVMAACSVAAAIALTGCSISAEPLRESIWDIITPQATDDVDGTSARNYDWEQIPDGTDSTDGSNTDVSGHTGSANDASASGTASTSAAYEGVQEETVSDSSDTAGITSGADAADPAYLWDPIPGEDTWGPFPDGQEIALSYAYNQLDADEQLLYEELRRMIRTREETNLSTLDKEEVNEIYNMVLADHPEIFYVSGYTITSHTRNGALEYLSARANYIYDADETSEYERLIDTAVDSILLQAPTEESDYTKVRFCYEYLIRNTDYDADAADNQNIISVFLNHASVCNGYAKAFQYLLLEMDVPATVVTGTSNNAAHAWDLVCIDGTYYYTDPTWGDAQFVGASDSAGTGLWITYDYLNITTADILTNHSFSDTIPLPECTDTTYNYYVQEGLYFDHYDRSQLHQIVNAAYEDGSLVIRFRCASAAVYQEMRSALIDSKGIYDYLYQANSISYTTSDSLYTFAIIVK